MNTDWNNRRTYIMALLLTSWFVMSPSSGADDPKAEPESADGFVALYNGSDLTGWKTTGSWQSQDNGVLALNPRDGEEGWKRFSSYLWAAKQYGDFSCDFEYKHEAGGNSGFYFRVKDMDDPVETGIEIQIIDSHGKKGLKKGKLTSHSCTGGVIRTKAAPSKNMTKPAGEWNRMVVTCVGNRLNVQLNGERVIDLEIDQTPLKDRPASGFIGIQDHGQNFWVRNVRIKTR